MDKWVERLNLMPLEMGLERHGDTIQNRIIFYETFLNQSDKVVSQFEREERYKLVTTLSEEEYLELEELREQAVLKIQQLSKDPESTGFF